MVERQLDDFDETPAGDPRDAFIAQVAAGRTFVDVGGLWGTIFEKVSVAYRAGASAVSMIDIAPREHDSWHAFTERCTSLGVPDVRLISGDVVALAADKAAPQYDVVHCAGVLYHTPNPLATLAALRKITTRYLILSCCITSTRIETDQGVLDVPKAAALFVPGLEERESHIISSHWRPYAGEAAIGLTQKISKWDPHNHIAWWWLPTLHTLKSMCESVGFVCEDESFYWDGNSATLKLTVADVASDVFAAPDAGETPIFSDGPLSQPDRSSTLLTRIAELEQDKAWIEHERQQLQRLLDISQKRVAELDHDRVRLDQPVHLELHGEGHSEEFSIQRPVTDQPEEARTWLEEQRAGWEQAAKEYAELVGHQQEWIRQLEDAKAWLEEQRANWQRTAEEYRERLIQAK